GRGDAVEVLLAGEEIRALPPLLPVLLRQRTVIGVGSGAGHQGDVGQRPVAHRRVEVRRLNPHLLDRVFAGEISGLPARAVTGDTVDRPFVAADTGAGAVIRRAGDGVRAKVIVHAAGENTRRQFD